MLPSLRKRLMLFVLSAMGVTWLVSVAVTTYFAERTVVEQVDRQLQQYSAMVNRTMQIVFENPEARQYFRATIVPSDIEGVAFVDSSDTTGLVSGLKLNIWLGDLQLLSSADAPVLPKPDQEGIVVLPSAGSAPASQWRVLYKYNSATDDWLAVALDLSSLQTRKFDWLVTSLMPAVIVFPFTLVLLWFSVNRGLRPLARLSSSIEARRPLALEPIELAGIPAELESVVDATNRLFDRLNRALQSESRFTANAAHELQTPLASIKAEVQRCQRECRDPQVNDMLDGIATRVTRATATVTQLLTLARLDPDQSIATQSFSLNELVLDVLAEEGNAVIEKALELEIPEDSEVYVSGNRDWLAILVRNLLSNACKYSPNGGTVCIRWWLCDAGTRLSVSNDCDAIDPALFSQLTDRFFSLPSPQNTGVGLGLSIVQRIAALHNAALHLGPWRGREGFQATIIFRAAS